MKVGKEEIMGFVTALGLYLAQDFEQEMSVCIKDALQDGN
jgi:seryl-tRNA(Sec) selenium transferase